MLLIPLLRRKCHGTRVRHHTTVTTWAVVRLTRQVHDGLIRARRNLPKSRAAHEAIEDVQRKLQVVEGRIPLREYCITLQQHAVLAPETGGQMDLAAAATVVIVVGDVGGGSS